MQNLQFDPTKRDYLVINGKPVPSDRIEDAALIALKIPLNLWLYGNPNQGSLLYTLTNVKHDSSLEQRFASYAQDAIKRQLIQTGLASAVQATNISQSLTRSSNRVQIVPGQSQISNQLTFNPVG